MMTNNTAQHAILECNPEQIPSMSQALNGDPLTVGEGFNASSFRASEIGETMDPLVMVDHYVMTKPTFGAHPHAGMSAVSLLFENTQGLFHNRDSLGNNFDLQPGDLYWLSAGSGAVHDESPRQNARIHGLQVFVNVPQSQRFEAPTSLLVRASEMPVITDEGVRVKIALGESNGVHGAASPSNPMTILDGTLQTDATFIHQATLHSQVAQRGIWVHVIEGSLEISVGGLEQRIAAGQATAIQANNNSAIEIRNSSNNPAHFALFDGAQIAEDYIQDGPFVMGSHEEVAQVKAAFEAGELGNLADAD